MVFARDGCKCLFCNETTNLDAHHIFNRNTMPNGGYTIENGATLCHKHHIEAEANTITPNQIFQKIYEKENS